MNIKPYVSDIHESELIKILREPNGHFFEEEHVDLNGFHEAYIYEESERLLGFLCIEVHPNTSQIVCYVSPSYRCKGIGSKLFEFGKSRLEALDPNTIWLFFRNDVGQSARFYQKRGAVPWYSYHNMRYKVTTFTGDTQTVGFDQVTPYAAQWFDAYLEVRASAFHKVNQLIDSRPYDERERRDQIEAWTMDNASNLWLFFNEGELVGSVANFEGFLDEVFVKPELQGQGIGKAIISWALMQCRNKGWEPQLCVVTKNTPAIKLYESMGFEIAQTLEMNRLFSVNKTPDYSGPIGG